MGQHNAGAAGRVSGAYGATYELPAMELHALGPGAVVVVRGMDNAGAYAALRAALRPDVLLVHLDDGATLESLDEDAMRAAGWVRA